MDIFGNDPTKTSFDPNPNGVTEGDVVEIPHKSTSRKKRTGLARHIEQGSAWVESDVKKATGWYPLVCLSPTRNN
jgi:hypothetical protein